MDCLGLALKKQPLMIFKLSVKGSGVLLIESENLLEELDHIDDCSDIQSINMVQSDDENESFPDTNSVNFPFHFFLTIFNILLLLMEKTLVSYFLHNIITLFCTIFTKMLHIVFVKTKFVIIKLLYKLCSCRRSKKYDFCDFCMFLLCTF